MSKPKPAQEWMVEYLNSCWTYGVGNRDAMQAICNAHNAALAAEREKVTQLEGWKQSAMSVMPDYQAIGKALGLPLGADVNKELIPAIQQLRSQLAVTVEALETIQSRIDKKDLRNVIDSALAKVKQ